MVAAMRLAALFMVGAGGLSPRALSAGDPSAAAALKLAPITQLRKGVDLWPLIAMPATPAEERVNATLTRLNTRLAKAVKDCDASYADSFKDLDAAANKKYPVSEDWSRTVNITMNGPRFLSLVASDAIDCGGAHPDNGQMAMVFDLTTGKPVDWTKMLAPAADAKPYTDTSTDGSTIGALIIPALKKMAVAAANSDCAGAFEDSQSFQLWPDAEHGTLVAQPFDLPHVVQACGDEIDLTLAQARKLGFDESLLGAIAQAHRGFASGKRR